MSFFYSSAFKSKTEKIENFSENSKKSLTQYSIGLVMWGLQAYIATIKKMLQIRHWIFVLVFFFPNHISRNRIIVSLNSFGFSMWSKWSASLTHANAAFGNTWNRNYFETVYFEKSRVLDNHKKQLNVCITALCSIARYQISQGRANQEY